MEDLVWLRDLDGTGSMHACSKGDPGAVCYAPADRIEALEGDVAAQKDALAMAVAEMSKARGRLETIATCNEDRRIAAALGSTCDHIRRVAFTRIDAILQGGE